ncbi:MAG: NAD(P)-dependent alcohol dehydrogenase [Pseudomonadota bacterium]
MKQRRVTAAVARNPGAPFSIEGLFLNGPAPNEVLIRIAATGLCHTDLTVKDAPIPPALPAVLGHEGAGIVEAIGPAAQEEAPELKIGDRVVLSFASCGVCPSCHASEPGYCNDGAQLNYAGRRADGECALHDGAIPIASHFFGQSSFATYACVYPRNIIPAPSHVPIELLGPFGCSILTGAGTVMKALDAQPGSSLLITGGGAVGLSAVMAGKLRDCATIIVSDPIAARRAMAKDLGATHVHNPEDGPLRDAVYGITQRGVDRALDTTGRPDVLEACANVLAKRGALASLGIASGKAQAFQVKINALMSLGRRVMGVIEGDSDPQELIPLLLEHHRRGAFPFEKLITNYPLEEINQAVADQAAGLCVKPVLVMPNASS